MNPFPLADDQNQNNVNQQNQQNQSQLGLSYKNELMISKRMDIALVPLHVDPVAGVPVAAHPGPHQVPSLDFIKMNPDLIVTGSTSFTWHITNWSTVKKVPDNRFVSPIFTIPDDSESKVNNEESTGTLHHKCAWRLLLFPNGNRGGDDCMSVFLECVELGDDGNVKDHSTAQNENTRIPESEKWHVCAYFHIVLQHAESNEIFSLSNGASHRFNRKETDWGFSQFCNHAQLSKPGEGMAKPCLENDQFSLRVFIKRVQDTTGVLWHNFADWDSKLETGYVGIKNQGATCYLNSLIQSLYYTSYFRKATYEIPTQNDDPTKSVAYALQRLFYHMQFSTDAVGTNELTKSFGWDTMDAFHQHDVQELNRVLQDNLENTMKGTPAEGAIRKLFTGKMKSYIKCVNVNYESSRVEDYYDIQLNVKGCKNLYESFVDYCKVEMLDGENKYFAEGFGLQDAKKGVIFESFPPVLHLQLKRFDYDMERDQFVKINDRHEFPMSIDISEFLSTEADRSVSQKYLLQGVLVHSGDLNAGHYYALLRPKKNGPWFKYDDDKVVPATYKDVLDANFGGDPIARSGMKHRAFFTNAYMLVYIRESDEDEILAEVTENHIPIHLRNRVKRDIEEAYARRIEEQERHLYLQVHVVNDNDLLFHSGFDIGFPYDPKTATSSSTSPVRVFKAKRDQSLSDFLDLYANEINVDPSQVRFWNIVTRQNKTLRIESPFPMEKIKACLDDVVSYQKQSAELRIYAQLAKSELSKDAFAGSPRINNPAEKDILIFIKQYDPLNQSMRVALTVSVRPSDQISSILPSIQKVANFSEQQPMTIYEEVKPGMIEKVNTLNSFAIAELVDGDILIFQQDLTGPEMDSLRDPTLATAPGYYELLRNRIQVHFKHRGAKDGSQEIVLVLNKKMSYEQVVTHLSNEIHHDAAKIKLYSSKVNGNSGLAVSQRHSLHEMTASNLYALQNQSFLLFYELLDISLEELEMKKYVKLSYLENGIKEHGPHSILIEKKATLKELAAALFTKLELSETDVNRQYRFVEVSNNRRAKVFSPNDVISFLNEFAFLYLESFDEEECGLLEGKVEGKMVEVFHFFKDVYRSHSIPFTFLLIPGEVFSATKERLARRMNLPKKDFDKIKVAIVPRQSKPTYPEDDDMISLDIEGVAIGLDHIDKGRKTGGVGLKIN